MEQIERQELHCHNCGQYVQFDMDMSLNGNHVLTCPVCGHEHCRVVVDGKITQDRWDSRNPIQWTVSSASVTYSAGSTYTSYSGSTIMYNSWMNTTATG